MPYRAKIIGSTLNKIFDEEKWVSLLTDDEKEAIYDYTKEEPPYYKNINRVLRGQEKYYENGNDERSELIHSALSKATTSSEMTLYRGVDIDVFEQYGGIDENLVGKVFLDRGFVSTSMTEGAAFRKDVLMVISLPAGSRAASILSLSAAGKYEQEVLLDKGYLFRITGCSNDEYGRIVLSVDVIG